MFCISSIFIGHKDDTTKGPIFDMIDVESKRKNQKTGKPNKIKFLKETHSSQMIKVPRAITLSDTVGIQDSMLDEETSITIDQTTTKYLSNVYNGHESVEEDICVLLNEYTMSPYLAKKSSLVENRDFHYVFLIMDTAVCKLIKCEDGGKIINTFRQPQKNRLGCLLELSTDDNEVVLYVKDEAKFGFKKIQIYIDVDRKLTDGNIENLVITRSTKLTKEELAEVRSLWGKKQKTRAFQYTYNFLPSTKITYDKNNHSDDSIEIKTREECGDEQTYLKEIEKSLVDAVGYIPRSILLEDDLTDLTYKDMIALRFNYVLAVRDGGIVTLKSN